MVGRARRVAALRLLTQQKGSRSHDEGICHARHYLAATSPPIAEYVGLGVGGYERKERTMGASVRTSFGWNAGGRRETPGPRGRPAQGSDFRSQIQRQRRQQRRSIGPLAINTSLLVLTTFIQLLRCPSLYGIAPPTRSSRRLWHRRGRQRGSPLGSSGQQHVALRGSLHRDVGQGSEGAVE